MKLYQTIDIGFDEIINNISREDKLLLIKELINSFDEYDDISTTLGLLINIFNDGKSFLGKDTKYMYIRFDDNEHIKEIRLSDFIKFIDKKSRPFDC